MDVTPWRVELQAFPARLIVWRSMTGATMDSKISAKLGLSHPAVDAQKTSPTSGVGSPGLFEQFMQVSRGAASASLTERGRDVTRDSRQEPKLDRPREEVTDRDSGIDRTRSNRDDEHATSEFVSVDNTDETIAELEHTFGEEIVLQSSVAITQATTDTDPLVEIQGNSSDGQTVETIVSLPNSVTEGVQAATGVVQTTEQTPEVAPAQPTTTVADQQLAADATSESGQSQTTPNETSSHTDQEEPGQQQGHQAIEYLQNTGEIDSNKVAETPIHDPATEPKLPSTPESESTLEAGDQQEQPSQTDNIKWFQAGGDTPAPLEAPAAGQTTQTLPPGTLATDAPIDQSSLSAQDSTAAGAGPVESDAVLQEAAQPNHPQTAEGAATAAAPWSGETTVQISTQAPSSAGLGSSPAVGGAGRSEAGANRAGANQTSVANEPDSITQHERIRLIQRVSRSFSRLTPTGGEITLRLHPPQLGSLAVKVQMEGNTLSARLATESQAAREIIVENLPILRKRLAEQGIEVTQMHVDVTDGSSDTQLSSGGNFGAGDSRHGDRAAQERTAQYRRAMAGRNNTESNGPATTAATASTTPQSWVVASSIDIHA